MMDYAVDGSLLKNKCTFQIKNEKSSQKFTYKIEDGIDICFIEYMSLSSLFVF